MRPSAFRILFRCTSILLETNPCLFHTFMQHDFLCEYAESLCRVVASAASLSDSSSSPVETHNWHEFWSSMSQSICHFISPVATRRDPNRSDCVAKAIEGGILTAALICLLNFPLDTPHRSDYEQLKILVTDLSSCNLQLSRVVKALSKAYPTELLNQVKKRKELEDFYWRLYFAFNTGLAAFDLGGSSVNLCDNLKVRI